MDALLVEDKEAAYFREKPRLSGKKTESFYLSSKNNPVGLLEKNGNLVHP